MVTAVKFFLGNDEVEEEDDSDDDDLPTLKDVRLANQVNKKSRKRKRRRRRKGGKKHQRGGSSHSYGAPVSGGSSPWATAPLGISKNAPSCYDNYNHFKGL